MAELFIFVAILVLGIVCYAAYTCAPTIIREIIATVKWHINK